MRGLKPRVGLLGLIAILLVSLLVTAAAEAQGPFWYHKAMGAQGKGVKISAQTPEEVRGTGGEAIIEGKLLGETIVISAKEVQVKGIIYNNALQAQAKFLVVYVQPTLVKPAISCAVTIGTKNTVKVFAHMAWTWNGEKKQLEEQPQANQNADWIFLGQEIQQGAKGLPTGVPFSSITISDKEKSCILAGTAAVTGSIAASIGWEGLGTFGLTQWVTMLENGALQHFWNGTENIGAETALKFGNEPAKLRQTITTETFGRQGGAKQEVAAYGS